MRLALAQYRELAAFSQFASDLDEQTRKQLERGERIMELMKQKQYSPLTIAETAISLFAADRGYLDDVETAKVGAFESALHANLNSEHAELAAKINESGDYDDEIESQLKNVVEKFKADGAW